MLKVLLWGARELVFLGDFCAITVAVPSTQMMSPSPGAPFKAPSVNCIGVSLLLCCPVPAGYCLTCCLQQLLTVVGEAAGLTTSAHDSTGCLTP